ncbi:MAG: leucine-rich repeat domain-containing protein [Paludibacteraceae bacterium]|nr:leucine-rich repeat domain-containing protein [Paludibacteraceae bacterium]
MKKLFSVFLCLTVWLSASAFEVNGISYTIIGNGEVEVSPISDGYSGNITIPSTVRYNDTDYSVTAIGNSAFSSCTQLTSVVIPNSVTTIKMYAFSSCVRLSSITIPNSVTTIGMYAFYSSGLSSVSIGNSVVTIEACAFYSCYNLTSVIIIPHSVKSIGAGAFENCENIKKLVLGRGLLSIENAAFWLVDEFCPNSMLDTIICYAPIPPVIDDQTFKKYNATLYVPASSDSLYRSALYWRNFNIQPIPEEPAALDYNLADRNVIYVNGRVYNEDGLNIKLFDVSGRLISSGNGDIEMSSCPNGIYIVTDGKGGFLKINHYR